MNANYITHLIRIQWVEQDHQLLNHEKKQQKYVPEIITHLHVLPYDFNPTTKNTTEGNLSQVFSKVCQFIEHAHEEGQSCIIINSDAIPHQSENESGKNIFECVYRPAVIAVGYLMCRYSWGMLKAVQFANSRLTAGQKTNQTLQFMNNTKNGSGIHSVHQTKNNNNLSSVYSQLLTHMVPQISYQGKYNNVQCWPDLSYLPVSSLSLLEMQLTGSKNRVLTYGWNKSQKDSIPEEEVVITNTYLNSLMITENHGKNGGESNRVNSYSREKQRSDSYRGSLNTGQSSSNLLSREIGKDSESIMQNMEQCEERELGILKSQRGRLFKNRHSISLGIIGLKTQNSNNITNKELKKQNNKQLLRIRNENNRLSSCKKAKSIKNKEMVQKKVTWSHQIIESIHQQQFGYLMSNISSKRQSRISSFDDNIQCVQMDVYKKLIRNKISHYDGRNNDECYENQRENNMESVVDERENKKPNKIMSNSVRNKIVVNVIGMINNKNKNVPLQSINNQRSLINKKSNINQSKAKLPTIHQILHEQNVSNKKKQEFRQNQHVSNSEIFRCKTISNLQYMEEKQNYGEKKQLSKGKSKRDLLKKYLDVELDVMMSQGNESNKGKISKTLAVSKITEVNEHESDGLQTLRLQTEPNHTQKQNKNKENIVREIELQEKCEQKIGERGHDRKQVSPKKLVIKNKMESTMNKLKQYKNNNLVKYHGGDEQNKIEGRINK